MADNGSKRGWAKVALGLSLLFGVGIFVYFSAAGTPLRGSVLGLLIIVAGYVEYWRKMTDERTALRYEADAEESKERHR